MSADSTWLTSADGDNLSPLGLGETSPDSEWLTDGECVLGTGLAHGADLAYGLGSGLSTFTFVLAFKSRRGEEQMGVVSPTKGPDLPIVRQPHGTSLSGRTGGKLTTPAKIRQGKSGKS